MNRREFLAKSGSIVGAVTCVSLSSGSAIADYSCGGWRPYAMGAIRECEVGFRIGRITAQQECDQWCWAACIQAAFDLYGHGVEQRDIVEKVFGPSAPCRPSVGPEIAYAVEGRWRDGSGETFWATTRTHTDVHFGVHDPFAIQNASRYLANDIPVIVGALGHATLLTGMQWIEDNFGNWQLMQMTVRDPWPSNLNRRNLSQNEFNNTTYLAAVIVG